MISRVTRIDRERQERITTHSNLNQIIQSFSGWVLVNFHHFGVGEIISKFYVFNAGALSCENSLHYSAKCNFTTTYCPSHQV